MKAFIIVVLALSQCCIAGTKKEAIDLLSEVRDTYKKAPAVLVAVDATTVTNSESDTPHLQSTSIEIKDEYGVISTGGVKKIWENDVIYYTLHDAPELYLQEKAKSFLAGLDELPDAGQKPFVVVMRDSRSLKKWISALSLGSSDTKVVGVRVASHDSNVQIIELIHALGKTEVTVNTQNLIEQVVNTITIGNVPTTVTQKVETTFVDTFPSAPFEHADKTRVRSLEELRKAADTAPSKGDPQGTDSEAAKAPDFTLQKLDGTGSVTLSDLQGKIVVLDFWATWCGPCKKGLPYLNEFDAKHGSDVVEVFAVNIWERGEPADVRKKVSDYWKSNSFETTVLLGSSVAELAENYGINGIPTTVIIDMNGNVFDTHVGFSTSMVADLERKVQSAYDASK